VAGTALAALTLHTTTASAGIPECGGIRLEDAGNCEIRGEIECEAGCDDLGVYKKACATKLHTVCREDCTLLAEPVCEDECTTACASDCDRGINITCIHNCFGECVGGCDAQCEGAADMAQCRASCEATCDGECDIQCEPVVDASCYQHCVECCHGSCGARANMDCQTTCQDKEFEDCEYELRVDCDASCSGSGALFCDGEYVLSGDELNDCIQALIARGIGALEFAGEVEGKVGLGSESASAGCQLGAPGGVPVGAAWWPFALGTAVFWRRRRRTESQRER
jgi:MYXO-CTERM domain-containing protein